VRDTPPPTGPRPYRVSRWGKFWSLEPLFAEGRPGLIAKGTYQPQTDDVVLAVSARGNRLTVLESLGSCESLATILRALVYAQGVRQGFGDEVTAAAAAATERGRLPDQDRRELTALATFTIDPDAARDFDDAISVAREGDGYRAHVHIADVSYFVDADGAIDDEARRRTASLYLPLWAEPMLPPTLSADVCSLRPGQERKCITAEFTFAADGTRTSVQFYRSLIKSDHRLTYGLVDEVLAGADQQSDELAARLLLAWELAGVLRRRRLARGALQIGSFEPEYRFDAAGQLIGAEARPESPSHSLVEEFMLAANEAVAGYLIKRRARAIYRVHAPPDAAGVERLLAMMEELGVPAPPLVAGEASSSEQLGAALRGAAEALARVGAAERRGHLAFPHLVLRSLKQAFYGTRNLGHFGLASPGYLHFTSPIRRYPDLAVHRALLKHLGEGGDELAEVELAEVAELCSQRERAFAEVERTADDVALAFLLEGTLRERGWESVFEGEVVGLVPGGVFVHFGGCYEGYLPVRALGSERFALSAEGTAQVGERSGSRLRLGDAMDVRVARVDRLRGKVDLLPAAESDERGAGASAAGRSGSRVTSPRRARRDTRRRAPAGRRRSGGLTRRPSRW
jgi:ribonuclease R